MEEGVSNTIILQQEIKHEKFQACAEVEPITSAICDTGGVLYQLS